VATDLVGRGIDIERVNIVINYDMPDSADTYLQLVIITLPCYLWLVFRINEFVHSENWQDPNHSSLDHSLQPKTVIALFVLLMKDY
jgi:hypothetical protein